MATTRPATTPTRTETTTMKVAQVSKPGGDFEIVEREIPKPGTGEVRIKIRACGVCHSDVFTKDGSWPGIQYPRVPGHEVAGIVDEAGDGVSAWTKGQRVGVGWHGGQDNTCPSCRRGDFRNCRNLRIPGISYDGGYQQYMIAPVEALVAIPGALSDIEAAPLLCAGITTYNALRHSGALPGDLVAVQGIGGLGHLGIQFAKKFGYKVAAVGRGSENAALAEKLGATLYIDSKEKNAAEALQELGGAQVILATAPNSKAMSELINGLGPNGKLIVIGASFDPIEVAPVQLISGSRAIQGWAAGTAADSEDTLRFAELSGVRPLTETYPLEKAGEAYARMLSGKAQFRVVLTMWQRINEHEYGTATSKISAAVSAEQRSKDLQITLPAPPEAFGTYVEAVQTGNLLFLSGYFRRKAMLRKLSDASAESAIWIQIRQAGTTVSLTPWCRPSNAGVKDIEFLKAEIEHIPLPDNSVDVVISNCVINLSGDKDQVLREAFRV